MFSIIHAALIIIRRIHLVAAVLKVLPTSLWDDGVAAALLQLFGAHSVGSWSSLLGVHAEIGVRIGDVVAVVVLAKALFHPAGLARFGIALLVGRVVVDIRLVSIMFSISTSRSRLTLPLLLPRPTILLTTVALLQVSISYSYLTVFLLLLVTSLRINRWKSNITRFWVKGEVRNNPLTFLIIPL